MTRLGYQIPNFTYPDTPPGALFDAIARQAVEAEASSFDTVLYVKQDCLGAELVCDDDGGDGTQSLVTVDAQAGVPLIIVVDGFNAEAQGNVVLNVNPQ